MKISKFNWAVIGVVIALGAGIISNRLTLSQDNAELAKIGNLQNNTASPGQDTGNLESQVSSLMDDTSILKGEVSSQAGEIQALQQKTAALGTQANAVADAVNKVMPAVVYVAGEIEDSSGNTVQVSGSGVIMSSDGYILTNKHVVDGVSNISVVLQDRQIIAPSGVWEDDILDLAVVKIDTPNLTAADFADPSTIQVGEAVVALGHPLGLSPREGGATATAGIVSNLGRSFFIDTTPYYDIIQTDAAINPGNSGGPLINLSGQVIGINSAGASGAPGINFAINVATAQPSFDELVKYHRAYHPYLGVLVDDYTGAVCGNAGSCQLVGAVVTQIDPAGPSYQAGLRQGDIIVGMDSNMIASAADLIRLLFRHEVSETVKLAVQRGTTNMTITVTMPLRPAGAQFL